MSKLRHIVVLRFSAMGDVALTLPVVRAVLVANPDCRITMVTRPLFARFFSCIRLNPIDRERLSVFPVDLATAYAGPSGIWKMYRSILKLNPDTIVDLHDHLRTVFIRNLLRLSGVRVVVFEKDRKEKRELIHRTNRASIEPLTHTTVRYANAFRKAGLESVALPAPHVAPPQKQLNEEFLQSDLIRIGVAPFAAHPSKQWPLENFGQVIQKLSESENIRFILFGGKADRDQLQKIAGKQVWNTAGLFSLEEELGIMSTLDVMLTVDSSNMHMAGLCGIPVVSVWGGTHPMTGFGPAAHEKSQIVEIAPELLTCRPCSVFGKATCHRGDFACLTRIQSTDVVRALQRAITR